MHIHLFVACLFLIGRVFGNVTPNLEVQNLTYGLQTERDLSGIWKNDELSTLYQIWKDPESEEYKINIYHYTESTFSLVNDAPIVLNNEEKQAMTIKDGLLFYENSRFVSSALDILDSKDYSSLDVYRSIFQLFKKHYPFASLRGHILESLFAKYQSEVEALEDEDGLFQILVRLFDELGDNHVSLATSLSSDDGNTYFGSAIKEPMLSQYKVEGCGMEVFSYLRIWREKAMACIADNYLDRSEFPQDVFMSGLLNAKPQTAYLNISHLEDIDIEDLDAYLDVLLTQLKEKEITDLVIDLRFNLGGYDELGQRIVERFLDKQVMAYTSENFNSNKRSGKQSSLYLQPTSDDHVTKPDCSITVLLSPVTASAAEATAMMFRVLPKVKFIGQPSMGILSDQFARKLPNGWWLTLSNQIRRTSRGEIFEGEGVPVGISGKLISLADIKNQTDPLLDQLIKP